jgi:hypothetical protein
MSARVTVSTQAIASPPPGVVVDSGQAFIVGQTQRGPAHVPTRVFGLADFRAVFGERSGGTDAYDVVASAFKEGLGSAYILRAVGPTPVAATISLDSAKIVVTAKEYGAFANGWTAAYTTASKTITLVKGDTTVTYTGTTAAELEAAASVDPDVTVTVTSLPSGNVNATALASGTDDYGNVVVATSLAYLDADLGDGAVVWPGKVSSATASALQTHCEDTNRLGVLSVAAATSQANAIAAADAVTDGANLVLAWPHVTVSTNAGDLTIEPTGFVLGARARAHAAEGPQASPIRDIYGKAKWATGVEEDTTAAEWASLNTAAVSVIRTSNGNLRLYGWKTLDAPDDVTNLQGAQFRDVINRVAVGAQQIADAFVGRTIDSKGQALGEFRGQLVGFLSGMKAAFYEGADDPGYVVDVGSGVNSTASLATGEIAAAVGVRLAPTAEFVTIEITATDAAGAI